MCVQWTYMLDLIEVALERDGMPFVRLDGSMSQQQREVALNRFRTDDEVSSQLAKHQSTKTVVLARKAITHLCTPVWNGMSLGLCIPDELEGWKPGAEPDDRHGGHLDGSVVEPCT